MSYLVIGLTAVLSLGFAMSTWANQPVCGVVAGGLEEGIPVAGSGGDFIEGWNENETPSTSSVYGGSCYGFAYQPGLDYWLGRVEFMAGGLAGTTTIEIHADDGSGYPTGPLLASGSFHQYIHQHWQGVDLDPCVFVEQGTTYYIKYVVLVSSYCSVAQDGYVVPHSWAHDCSDWIGPCHSSPWMARFFGGFLPSASETSTWSSVKTLYR